MRGGHFIHAVLVQMSINEMDEPLEMICIYYLSIFINRCSTKDDLINLTRGWIFIFFIFSSSFNRELKSMSSILIFTLFFFFIFILSHVLSIFWFNWNPIWCFDIKEKKHRRFRMNIAMARITSIVITINIRKHVWFWFLLIWAHWNFVTKYQC